LQILFANTHNIPFLAKTGGHGAIDSLGNVHNGIEIWMRNLNQIQISPDGKTAISGGGVKVKEVVDTLWAAGKQTGISASLFTSLFSNTRLYSHWSLRMRWYSRADAW